MSQSQRQSELFAGQDWTLIYRAFTEVNLNAYDFDTISQAMKDYLQRNYPEDFNDWIESSEFVAQLDLMAYLGQMLAFRMDLNARENFMSLAKSRDSVLRLARFLSYSPKRNHAAQGLVKLTEIRCTQDIIDSLGNNLNNMVIRWDDPNNPNWFEQFVLVLNAVFINTNPFGTPLKAQKINGINTQLYRLENLPFTPGNLPFLSSVGGDTLSFDIVNVDFNTKVGFFERTPDPQAAFHLVYRNDGNGNGSANTGFFLMFKQGSLNNADIQLAEPQENRVIDLDFSNVNETDVWVHNVTDQGSILEEWTRVGYVPTDDINKIIINSDNVTYNSLPVNVQSIYQVITRQNDMISLRFGDGRFGKIPTGNMRVWYRQSLGQSISIRPDDMRNVMVNLPFLSKDQKQRTLYLTFSLQETIINSAPAESNEDIRRRSGAVYATQGRMVSGDDYNALPITNNLARKVKSVNRMYAGHSRYIDLNDPTGTYQNTNTFSDDGVIYRETHNNYAEIAITSTQGSVEIIANLIIPAIENEEMRDFLYADWLKGKTRNELYNFAYNTGVSLWWDRSINSIYSSTGRFSKSASVPVDAEWEDFKAPIGYNGAPNSPELFMLPGSLVKFRNSGWVSIANVVERGDGFKGNGEGFVRLNENVARGDQVLRVLPAFRRNLNQEELDAVTKRLDSKRSFGMGFDFVRQEWYMIETGIMDAHSPYDFKTRGSGNDSSWLVKVEYSPLSWRVTSRGIRHVFESQRDVKFFYVKEYKSIDPQTGKAGKDLIRVLSSNLNPKVMQTMDWTDNTQYVEGNVVRVARKDVGENHPSGASNFYECLVSHISDSVFSTATAKIDLTDPLNPKAKVVEVWRPVSPGLLRDYEWGLNSTYIYDDGHMEPRRTLITYADTDNDGQPDNPESFQDIVNANEWVFHERFRDLSGYEYYSVTDQIRAISSAEPTPVMDPEEIVFIFDPATDQGLFYQCKLSVRGVPALGRSRDIIALVDQNAYQAHRGRRNVSFQWKHYAPVDHRIDPAVTNIIDVFVLTKEYDDRVQAWLRAGAKPENLPRPPSELQLRMAYTDLEQYKMFSDQIVWRPVKYKFLFGNCAAPELKARFKIVKLSGTNVSDGEIKSRVLAAIQKFFDVNSWDFGETFYYTELASFIHKQMVNAIASVVIVPLKETQSFGELFEVRCLPDEIFFPTASVNDIEIIPANTQTSLRIR